MRTHDSIALGIPEVLLPGPGIDLSRWAVIACDQFTSEPGYWAKVEATVGQAPSALRLIYPEVFLSEKNPEERIVRIRQAMASYLRDGLFEESNGLVYLERTVHAHGHEIPRRGLMVCLDLEKYDFRKGSTSPIRATEGTILDRIPPRVKIREGAPIELPHIMVLVDDPGDTVLGPLERAKARLTKLYECELMLGSGHLTGHRVDDSKLEAGVVQALENLARPEVFARKCNVPASTPALLYAMGDGNHSLATAKTIWERAKEAATDKRAILLSPLRYALVELTNLHDPSLVFEPIHRVLFELAPGRDFPAALSGHFAGRARVVPRSSFADVRTAVDGQHGIPHKIGLCSPSGFAVVEVDHPEHNLPVGTLQAFLDGFIKEKGAKEIDYVHGAEPVSSLGTKPGNLGIYLPAMPKSELFRTVVVDGALPRKTFSMGEAHEKRFYLEARRIG